MCMCCRDYNGFPNVFIEEKVTRRCIFSFSLIEMQSFCHINECRTETTLGFVRHLQCAGDLDRSTGSINTSRKSYLYFHEIKLYKTMNDSELLYHRIPCRIICMKKYVLNFFTFFNKKEKKNCYFLTIINHYIDIFQQNPYRYTAIKNITQN